MEVGAKHIALKKSFRNYLLQKCYNTCIAWRHAYVYAPCYIRIVCECSTFVSSRPYLSFLTFCWISSCPISKFKRNPAATFRRGLPPSPVSLIDRSKTSNKTGKPSASRTNFLPLSENMQCSNKLSRYSNAKHIKMYTCQLQRSAYFLSTIHLDLKWSLY